VNAGSAPAREPVELRAVPYFPWANRGRGPMTVWLRQEQVAQPSQGRPSVVARLPRSGHIS
jgi:hypothetical protein